MNIISTIVAVLLVVVFLLRILPTGKVGEFLNGFWVTCATFTLLLVWDIALGSYIWASLIGIFLIAHIYMGKFRHRTPSKVDDVDDSFPKYKQD